MADQEGKVELFQDISGNYSGIPWLGFGGIWIWSHSDTVGNAIGDAAVDVIQMWFRNRSDTTLLSIQRRSDGRWCTIRRDEVVGHILNQETLALNEGKYAIVAIRSKVMTCIKYRKAVWKTIKLKRKTILSHCYMVVLQF